MSGGFVGKADHFTDMRYTIAEAPGNAIDLMDALKAGVEKNKAAKVPAKTRKAVTKTPARTRKTAAPASAKTTGTAKTAKAARDANCGLAYTQSLRSC